MKLRSIIAIALFAASAAYAKPAPDFTLMSLDGRTIHLAAFRGKVVLLNFWATWCAGCQVEMPRLAALYRQHHQQGLEIIGVSMDDAGEDVIAKFARSKHADYTIAKGNDAVAKSYGGVRFLPQTFVIDRNGNIVKSIAGPPEERDLEELIKNLLADPGS
jgi:peroxiredoxin